MKRLFVAIPLILSEDIISKIQELQHVFDMDKMRWIPTENTHLTLKFLGSTPGKRIKPLIKTLEKGILNIPDFNLEINRLGMFGSKHAPKVLWLGFDENPTLLQLNQQISQQLQEIGIEETRENFVPHVTIARIDKIIHKDFFQKQINIVKNSFHQHIPVTHFNLYESIFERSGVKHRIIHTFELEK